MEKSWKSKIRGDTISTIGCIWFLSLSLHNKQKPFWCQRRWWRHRRGNKDQRLEVDLKSCLLTPLKCFHTTMHVYSGDSSGWGLSTGSVSVLTHLVSTDHEKLGNLEDHRWKVQQPQRILEQLTFRTQHSVQTTSSGSQDRVLFVRMGIAGTRPWIHYTLYVLVWD